MEVLIAGCGDVGARAGQRLAAAGCGVHGINRSGRVPPPLRGLAIDLEGPLDALDGRSFDALVWCAAPATRDAAGYRAIFVDAPQRLLDRFARPPARLVFVSSSAVWGDAGGATVDAHTPARPDGWNGRILLEAEAALAARVPGAVLLRLAGLYGPGRTRLLTRAREVTPVQGEPPVWTNRIHLDDAAAAVDLLVRTPAAAGVYIGVDDAPAPEHEVLAWIAAGLGLPPPPSVRGTAPANKRLSNARLRALGWAPQYPDYRSGYNALIAAAVPTPRR